MTKNGNSASAIGSYHMQQNLQISTQLTKAIFDTVKKGDIEAMKRD